MYLKPDCIDDFVLLYDERNVDFGVDHYFEKDFSTYLLHRSENTFFLGIVQSSTEDYKELSANFYVHSPPLK